METFVHTHAGMNGILCLQLLTKATTIANLCLVLQATWRVQGPQGLVVKFLEGHTKSVSCLSALSHTYASGSADKVANTTASFSALSPASKHLS